MKGYVTNIEQETLKNENFRTVLYTSPHIQLVVMSVETEIGTETHKDTDQFIRVEKGSGKAILNGQEHALQEGSIVVIPAGIEHNIVNTGDTPLKLYTIYAPPHHKDGTVHTTKEEAEQGEEHFDGVTSE
ncbi:MAG TPA: cupin domain-containing protein [Candidatus Paceibacterota bacterium]